MKRPIDREHAKKWLIGFAVMFFIFSIAFFIAGEWLGGLVVILATILLILPSIIDLLKKKRKAKVYKTKFPKELQSISDEMFTRNFKNNKED